MLTHGIVRSKQQFILTLREKKKCFGIASFYIVQCVLVFLGSATVLNCVWSPDEATEDYDKLTRIMYLYDPEACGRHMQSMLAISNLRLGNDTHGLKVLPIRWQPAITTVTARFSSTTRWYLHLSIAVHTVWLLSAVLVRVFVGSTASVRYLKFSLKLLFYLSVAIVIFDLSMAIVYASHIKKSLTKGMILRYSGWSVETKLNNYTDFGGWIPIAAAICWMRGMLVLFINIYCIRAIHMSIRGIQKREVKQRLTLTENEPFPEAKSESPDDCKVLYFRTGESTPYIGNRRRVPLVSSKILARDSRTMSSGNQ